MNELIKKESNLPATAADNLPVTEIDIFCQEYIKDFDEVKAFQRAGLVTQVHSRSDLEWQAVRYLNREDVDARLQEVLKLHSKTEEEAKFRIARELYRIAFSNIKDLQDEFGNYKTIDQMPAAVTACIQHIEVTEYKSPFDQRAKVTKITLHDKKDAMKQIAALLNLSQGQINVGQVDTLNVFLQQIDGKSFGPRS